MAHKELIPTGMTLFGRKVLKEKNPEPKLDFAKINARRKETNRQLEKLHRDEQRKQAVAKGKKIRSKTRSKRK